MPAAIMECADFSEFQEALKAMRKVDDIIINTINAVVPTDSFHADESAACKDIHEQIQEGHQKREHFIKNCISYSTNNLKKLKNERESKPEDPQLSKLLRSEQTKLRMLQVELTVEDLIKERSMKVFSEKCRKYFKPSGVS